MFVLGMQGHNGNATPRSALFVTALLILGTAVPAMRAAPSADTDLERQFIQTVRPFLDSYCTSCHGGAKPAASFDLRAFSTMASVVRDYSHWALVPARLAAKEMPPQPMKQPPDDARQQVIDWIGTAWRNEARKNAGDPGVVLARRLSNAEYNYTIRDLTGVDLRPAREFPVDPANQAGFDNSGESLTMSPTLMAKYLQAAREVADHLVLKPDGIAFAPFPMLVETDRDKYAVGRILDFYARQPIDFADYFHAAWRYKHRAVFGEPRATLASIAAEAKVSPKYLPMVWQILEQTKEDVGPTAKLQEMWRDLPSPKANQISLAREGCVRMRDFVVRIRRHTGTLIFPPETAAIDGRMGASLPYLGMWKNREVSTRHRDFDRTALRVEGEPPPGNLVVTKGPAFGAGEVKELKAAAAAYIKERQEDPDLVVPAGQRSRYEAAFASFSSVFPDKFYLRERGRFYPLEIDSDKGRYLGAGFHVRMGYFRDDLALIELIIDEKAKKEIDTLWEEFEFIVDFSRRTYIQSANTGDGEAGAKLRMGYKDVAAESVIFASRDRALSRFGAGNPVIAQAIKDYFNGINATIRAADRARLNAEPRHLEALLKFAARAYRRPLARTEQDEILAYYHQLRDKNDLSHEDATRASIASLLVSPDFCYRVDLAGATPSSTPKAAGARETLRARPLSAYALASRLSYFLWSSMPDDELRARAGAGDLMKPASVVAQVRRMLKDDRARALATEFAGNWLDFRRFEDNNSVDRERFPAFTNGLRQAMFEEPIRFIADVFQNDRPVLDLLYGNYTFVNRVLAEHYRMSVVPGGSEQWIRVDNARAYGRGGLLPMAVFLTQNAPGLRTSPVKRGYWVARRVLGEVIPPPPPDVPELPQDESKSDLPVRDMLAKHRENALCASCHARFDSFGLTFEGYGPVGDRRTKDLAGRVVDTHATFPGGDQGAGLEGLQTYIRAHREKDFLKNLTEKLLVYALGRSPLLSDGPLLERMRTELAASGYRMSAVIETVVASPQFLNRRSPE